MTDMSWKNANKNIMKTKPTIDTVVSLQEALNSPFLSYKNQRLSENEKESHFLSKE